MFAGGAAALRRWGSSELRLRRLTTPIHLPIPSSIATSAAEGDSNARTGPPPIRVALTESAGRGVFATRAIGAGELIHTAKPLVAHASPSLSHRVCYYCLKKLGRGEASFPPLGGDGTAVSTSDLSSCYFCSERCRDQSKVFYAVERKADWSLYDDHCRARGLKYPFMVKRLACMVISGATSADNLYILQPASLLPETIFGMEEEFELLKCTFMKAQIDEKLMPFLTKQWYINVLARIRINAFRIELVGGSYEDLLLSGAACVAAEAAVGNAVYMLPSFYNHDCDPNVHIIWIDNADARLKALRDIEAGLVSYLTRGTIRPRSNKVRSSASATLTRAWIARLGRLFSLKGSVFSAAVLGAYLVIEKHYDLGIYSFVPVVNMLSEGMPCVSCPHQALFCTYFVVFENSVASIRDSIG